MSDVAEEDQTPEQRLQWLRDHGVEIDMPADRVPPSGSSSGASQAAQRFTFVHIPADSALSYEEKSVEVPAGSSGDFLKVWLKSVFADKKGIDDKALQKQFAGTAAAGVSAAALTSVAAAGAVETFPLVKPSPENDYVGVSLYLDEVGALKNLPRNERGCALADACGLVDVVLYGELFVGNRDFLLGELDSSAAWMEGAKAINFKNAQAQAAMSRQMGDGVAQIDLGGDGGSAREEDDGIRGYSWEQDGDDVEVEVAIPADIGGKQVKVQILPRRLVVDWSAAGLGAVGVKDVLELELYDAVRPSDSTWTLEGGVIQVTLEKAQGGRWPSLVKATQ